MQYKLIYLVILLFLAISQSLSAQESSPPSFKIGVITPITGPRASIGEDAKQASELALDDLKASGILKNSSVQLIFEDSQGDPAKGLSAYKKLLIDGVKLVITQNSNTSMPIAPLVTKDGVIQLAITTTSDKYSTPDDNTFRVNGDTTPESKAIANFIISRQNNDSGLIGIVTMEDEYPQSLKTHIINNLGLANIKADFEDNYLPKETDFRALITKLKGKQIKHLVILGFQTEVGYFVKQSRELNFNPATLITNVPVNNREFFEIAKNGANGVFCAAFFINKDNSIVQRFSTKFHKVMTLYSANAYDAVMIAGLAYVKCGFKDDIECLKTALYSTKDYTGASGHKSMDDLYGDMQDEVTIFQGKNGQFEPFQQ